MADDILTSFLVRIAYAQDDKSRKSFDEGLRQVQGNVQDFSKRMESLPATIDTAMKKISSSFSELYFNARKMDLLPNQLKAIQYAGAQSGEGADKAASSFEYFADRIHKFAGGVQTQIEAFLKHSVTLDNVAASAHEAKDKITELYNTGNRPRAEVYAQTFFGEKASDIAAGDPAKRRSAFDEDMARMGAEFNKAAEKGKSAHQAVGKLKEVISVVSEKAEASLFDTYGATLNKISDWIDAHQAEIIKFLKDLTDQFVIAFQELSDFFGPKLKEIADLIMGALAALDKLLGDNDGGVRGLRYALEALFAAQILAGLYSLGVAFTAALLPLTRFLGLIAGLGLLGAGAYAIYRSFTDDDALDGRGPGRGRGGETSLGGVGGGGAGSRQRGTFGVRGARHGDSKATGEIADYIRQAAAARGIDPDTAIAVANSEGLRGLTTTGIDKGGDDGSSFGAFQLHIGGLSAAMPNKGIGDDFMAATGLDPRNKSTYRAQVDFALDQAKKKRSWGAWRGARNTGVGLHQGFDYTPPAAAKPPALNIPSVTAGWHKALETIRSKPITPWQTSWNHNDHRKIENNVEIAVAGGSMVNATERPLDRSKMAGTFRNVRGSIA